MFFFKKKCIKISVIGSTARRMGIVASIPSRASHVLCGIGGMKTSIRKFYKRISDVQLRAG